MNTDFIYADYLSLRISKVWFNGNFKRDIYIFQEILSGETPKDIAKKHNIIAARVLQIREKVRRALSRLALGRVNFDYEINSANTKFTRKENAYWYQHNRSRFLDLIPAEYKIP